MTRREFHSAIAAAAADRSSSPAPLTVPIHLVLDGRAKWRPEQISYFWSRIWPEAVGSFASGGIRLAASKGPGEVRRSPGDKPVFTGLDRGAINMIITDQIPLRWDNGRGLSGVTTRYEGYDLCMIALDSAHCHQIPLVSVNTCVHELLHALLRDILEAHPQGLAGAARELRIDWHATRLWLFHDGADIRKAAVPYLEHLRAERGNAG